METNERERKTENGAPAPGETVFTSVLCLAGAVCFSRAVKLWNVLPKPRIASAAVLPLGASALWTVLSFWSLIDILKKTKKKGPEQPASGRAREAFGYAFPKTVFIVSVLFAAYGVSLLAGLSFYTVTPLFLFFSMSYLNRGRHMQNIIRTAICMAVIVLVFRLLFSIVLP